MITILTTFPINDLELKLQNCKSQYYIFLFLFINIYKNIILILKFNKFQKWELVLELN